MNAYQYGCLLDPYDGVQHTASYNDDLRHKTINTIITQIVFPLSIYLFIYLSVYLFTMFCPSPLRLWISCNTFLVKFVNGVE